MELQRTSGGILLPNSGLKMGGKFIGSLVRDGKVIDEFEEPNLVTNEGLNSILSVYLNSGTQLPNWYLGIFQANYTPVSTDTAAVIAANSTESTAYSGGVRPTWTPAAPSSQSITNSASRATYTFTGSVTIYGAFLVSNSTQNGTSGTLFAAAQFSASKAVVSGDQLLLTYTFTASST